LPPGFADRKSQPVKSEPAAPRAETAAVSDRSPPRTAPAAADRKLPSDRLPPAAPVARPAEETAVVNEPTQPVQEQPPQPAAIDGLMPPGAEPSPAPHLEPPPEPARQPALVDALLPPGAAADGAAAGLPGEQVSIPAAPRPAPLALANQPAGTIALLAEGGVIAIKDTPKTIVHGDEEIEVRRLTPHEKAARRFRRNIILGSICLAILVAVVAFLLW
jgi:hypothetical protein